MRIKVELVSPSDDGDGDDDGAVGIGGEGRGPLGVLGDCPPTNDAVGRAGEVTAVRSSSIRAPGPPNPADIDWVALAAPLQGWSVKPLKPSFPAPLTGVGAVGETGATGGCAGGLTPPPPKGAATFVTGARTVAARLVTGVTTGLTVLVTGARGYRTSVDAKRSGERSECCRRRRAGNHPGRLGQDPEGVGHRRRHRAGRLSHRPEVRATGAPTVPSSSHRASDRPERLGDRRHHRAERLGDRRHHRPERLGDRRRHRPESLGHRASDRAERLGDRRPHRPESLGHRRSHRAERLGDRRPHRPQRLGDWRRDSAGCLRCVTEGRCDGTGRSTVDVMGPVTVPAPCVVTGPVTRLDCSGRSPEGRCDSTGVGDRRCHGSCDRTCSLRSHGCCYCACCLGHSCDRPGCLGRGPEGRCDSTGVGDRRWRCWRGLCGGCRRGSADSDRSGCARSAARGGSWCGRRRDSMALWRALRFPRSMRQPDSTSN